MRTPPMRPSQLRRRRRRRVSFRRAGNPKVLPACTLPLTGRHVVSVLVTELGVFDVRAEGAGLRLVEIAPGVSLESLRACTAAGFEVADELIEMRQ